MIRSEYSANQDLASARETATWMQPSRAQREVNDAPVSLLRDAGVISVLMIGVCGIAASVVMVVGGMLS